MTPSAKAKLISLDFTSEIEYLTRDFSVREWLFEEVEKWLRNSDETFFIHSGGVIC
jgi:hypothetical protein